MALLAPTSHAAVPGENGLIAFTTARFSDSGRDICVMDPDGGHRVAVVEDPADERDVAWSPDGTRLAFASDRAGTYDIYVLDVATNELHRLTTGPARDLTPEWSPDGTEIAYISGGGERQGLYVMNADGSDERRLTSDAGDFEPSWSPDGTSIGFSNDSRDGQPDDGGTWVIPREGGSPALIGGGHDFDWSPRGDEIVTTNLFGGGVTVEEIETGQHRRIAGFRPTDSPAWSPDGEKVVFGGIQPTQKVVWTGGIFVAAADGSGTRRLVRESDVVYSIDWQAEPEGGTDLPDGLLRCRTIKHQRTVTLRVKGRKIIGWVKVLDGYRPCRNLDSELQLQRMTAEGWQHSKWLESVGSGSFEGRTPEPGRYRVILRGGRVERASGRIDVCTEASSGQFNSPSN